MSRVGRSLRVQLAVVGFLAIYIPVLLLLAVVVVTEDETTELRDGVEIVDDTSTSRSPWTTWTAVALGPVSAGLAWWWAGRAVRPISRVREVAEDIEAADLTRRIALERGPAEVVALASSFDAMLDRLQEAAETQRHLIEETSHELRTPLSVLAANADVHLAHPNPTAETYRQALERSKTTAAQMQTTIDRLLTDARRRARTIDRQPADVRRIANGVVDDARVLAAPKRIELSLTGAATAPCSIDEPTVTRAISNLVDNAIRHAPERSAVEIEVDATESHVRVGVIDHGPGLTDAEQEHIFERFWRGRSDDGAGLGLPIARQIAVAHGGDLTVTSPGPAGDGCEFRLRLPR